MPMLPPLLLAALVSQTPQPGLSPGGDTALSVRPVYTTSGAAVSVVYNRPGPDGCYRQSGVTTTIEGEQITHAYRTWAEGDVCTEALVRGGFSTTLVAPPAGQYQGEVRINGGVAATYVLHVLATQKEAERALLAAAATFDDWTLQQTLGAMTPEQKPLARALLPRMRKVLTEQLASPVWYAVLQFLVATPHLDLVRAARKELAAIPESGSTAYAYHKWIVLSRITPAKELAKRMAESACTYSGPTDAIFESARQSKTAGLCAAIRKTTQRIRKDCNRWHNGYAALLATPACRQEVITLLNDDPPDFSLLSQLEPQAAQEPYRSLIRRKSSQWDRGLAGDYADSYRQILKRLEAAAASNP